MDNDFTSILGDSVLIRVVQEFIADPDEPYSISYMHELTGSSKPAVRDAFNLLLDSKLINRANKNDKRPLFKIDKKSNRFIALTLLSYAVLDDFNKTNIMEEAIKQHIGNMKLLEA
jgi:predicted AAA+ superfamily ATPase